MTRDQAAMRYPASFAAWKLGRTFSSPFGVTGAFNRGIPLWSYWFKQRITAAKPKLGGQMKTHVIVTLADGREVETHYLRVFEILPEDQWAPK